MGNAPFGWSRNIGHDDSLNDRAIVVLDHPGLCQKVDAGFDDIVRIPAFRPTFATIKPDPDLNQLGRKAPGGVFLPDLPHVDIKPKVVWLRKSHLGKMLLLDHPANDPLLAVDLGIPDFIRAWRYPVEPDFPFRHFSFPRENASLLPEPP